MSTAPPTPHGAAHPRPVLRYAIAALLASTCVMSGVAYAQDATWVGGNGPAGETNGWQESPNWTPATVPTGTATFGATANTTVDNGDGVVVIGAINFTSAASAYTINVDNPFIVNGAGITNNSTTNTQTFNTSSGNSLVFQNASTGNNGAGAVTYNNNSGGFIVFQNTSNAGNANTTYVNNSIIQFNDSTSAGSANITNNVETDFFNTSTAANASITNASTGSLTFNGTSTAATAIIGNSGNVQFNNTSSGGSADITNSGAGATITFNNDSSAAGATINTTNTGVTVTFNNSSSAGTATFTSNPSTGVTYTFNNTSTAGSANFQLVDANLTFNATSAAGSAIITMPNLMHPGVITFNDSSSAGNANITNIDSVAVFGSEMQFLSASTAGNATITNNPNSAPGSGGTLYFGTLGGTDTANAGTATITNNSNGTTDFLAHTSASSATITNNSAGNTNFQDASSAASATIVNNSGGTTSFGVPVVGTDTATAGNANITNNSGGTTNFNALTTAGNAVITTLSGGSVTFTANSTGGSAQFITNGTGLVDFSGTTGPTGNNQITAGSIAGSGNYILGTNQLTVGSNNLSTNVSGAVSGVGGSLVKVGSGTLTLSGTNSYTGATAVNGGTLMVNGSIATSSGVTVNSGGVLAGIGTVSSTVLASGGTLSPGDAPGTITVAGSLTLNSGSILAYQLGTPNVVGGSTNDLTVVNGNLIINGGTLNVTNSGSFGPGVYQIIDYSGTLSGSGSLAVGTLPNGDSGTIQTAVPGEVNLVVSNGTALTQFWDGATTTGDGTIHGGSGTWNNSSTNWTTPNGTTNASWQGGIGVFEGAAGTVTVTQAVSYQGLQFLTTGYVVAATAGGVLTPAGVAPINVGSGLTTTISAPIQGAGGLQTTGAGTLILSGANTYSGGTVISAGTLQATNNNSVGTGAVTLDGGTFQSAAAGLSFSNGFAINTSGGTIDTQANTLTLSGTIGNGNGTTGALTKIGSGTLILTGTDTYSGGTTISAGTLQIGSGGTAGSITGNVTDNGVLAFNRSDTVTFGGVISGSGSLQQNGGIASSVILTANSTYTGGTTISAGTLQLGNGGTSGSITGNVTDNGNLAFNRSDNISFGGAISGTGTVTQNGPGTLTLPSANTYSGGTFLLGGTLAVGNNASLGSGPLAMVDGTILTFTQNGLNLPNAISLGVLAGTIDTGANSETLSGVISGPNDLTKIGSGTLILSANNTYTGPTNVNAGTLDVTGSIAPSSLTTVANGASLTGTGAIGNLQINSSGTFAPGTPGSPGTSTTVSGNLAFQSGAIYLVQLNPSSATSANVSGAATLTGATVNAQFASGSYVTKQYTILTAAGGLGGTTFAALTNTNLPAGTSDSLSYNANTVFLNLKPGFTTYTGLNINQQNVANALTNFFNTTGGIPAQFVGLSPNGLTQIDGEVATGGEFAAFQLMDEFLNLMLDPFVYGRGGDLGMGGGQALGFAPDLQASLPPDVALAYAGVLKAPPPAPFAQRWTAWGAAYGGGDWTSGNATVGSSNVNAQTYGFASGLDYHYSPDTIFGFALAGGGTNWGLASGNGTGHSDAFQAGVYGITRSGPAYLAAALAFTDHWMTTTRAAVGDELTANFTAQSYGGRVEAGYRFAVVPAVLPTTFGVTPYAALQAQDFRTPAYSETDVTGGGFGLSYNAMNATDTRTELGARFDDPAVVGGMPLLLRARIAWAHDFVSNPAIGAVFESLPGASFTVNGAPIPQNSALTSAGAELYITPHVTLIARFDGEFAPGSQTYAGSGTLRYSW